jgi:hypothetical protein
LQPEQENDDDDEIASMFPDLPLHNLYAPPNIIMMIKSRRVKSARQVAHMREMRNAYKILVGRPEKRPHIRPRHSWEHNVRMDLREIGWEGLEWMHLAQDRDQWQAVVNTVMKLQVPKKAGNFLII